MREELVLLAELERGGAITRFVLENPELIKLWIEDFVSGKDIRDVYPRWRNALCITTGFCLVIRFIRVDIVTFSFKKMNTNHGNLVQNGLQAFQWSRYNFRLGSFVDVAVRQIAVPSRKGDLNVR